MRESIEMPKGIFYTIVTICSLIIMLTSLEILIKAKDAELFNMWLFSSNLGEDLLTKTTDEFRADGDGGPCPRRRRAPGGSVAHGHSARA